MRRLAPFFFCVVALLAPGSLSRAATSTSWETAGFTDLLKGRFSGLSLSSEGTLRLGPSTRWNATLGQPALWSLAAGPDGNTYASTGHSGKVFRIGQDGKAALLWSAQQSEIFAMAVTADGVVLAGSSPGGGVYRIENGKAQEFWHSSAKYIWAIQPAPDGSVFVATGDEGRIFKIDSAGKAEVYYETKQANVTALALGANGRLYAGTEPNGLLYEITGPRQGTILLDSNLPEIRAIAIDASGAVYASAMGGAVASRTSTPMPSAANAATTVTASAPTVITVTEAQKNPNMTPADANAAVTVPADQSRSAAAATTTATPTPVVAETAGADKSAIYRINSDRTVETIRTSKEDNVYDLVLDENAIFFSTDNHGRIYRLQDGKTTLLTEPGDGETTRLIKRGDRFLAGLSNPARVLSLGSSASGGGWYEAQVHDSGNVSRWGHLQWNGNPTGVTFHTRSGNSARPDDTWSAWSAPIADKAHTLITSPVARFVQWRAEWASGSSGTLNSVAVPFLPQNAAPVVRSVSVTSVLGTNTAKAASNVPSTAAYSVTVTETGEAPAASTTSTANQTASRLQTTQTQISWQADDPDTDKLIYSVYFRAEDETNWQLIRNHIFENTLLLDPDVFADGRYLFRVVASDAPANAEQFAKQSELISTPVLIDNTPPLVTLGAVRRTGPEADLVWDAADRTSPLRRCEYSLDTGVWQPVEAADGVTDSLQEHFGLHLEKLNPGEHLIVIRVYDAAGNAGLARVVLRPVP